MTQDRKELLERFDNWFKTDPNKILMSASCANIAEDYSNAQIISFLDWFTDNVGLAMSKSDIMEVFDAWKDFKGDKHKSDKLTQKEILKLITKYDR